MADANLTAERLRELLHYDPETGVFTFRIATKPRLGGRAQPGKVAGSEHKTIGYVYLCIAKKKYLAHRVAWLYVHGEWPLLIDHINGVRNDNRLANLRDSSPLLNSQNRRVTLAGTGLIGAYRTREGRFKSSIRVGGRQKWLGVFDTAEDAHFAYLAAKRKLHQGCTI